MNFSPSRGLILSIQQDGSAWQQKVTGLTELFTSLARQAERELSLPQTPWHVDILLSDNKAVQALNHQYRGKDKPTNVLSFPQTEGVSDLENHPKGGLLGDIVLCWGVIEEEALSQKKSPLHHISHLFVHGLLHLLGFNHEDTDDAEHMEALEVSILKAIGIPNPYQEVTL
ncbi:MAG: rRNA maturation RNase YbeY [bacterium]|nr:rRNA maturation RNase YbeY [bacterium]